MIIFAYMKTPKKLTMDMMYERIKNNETVLLNNISFHKDFAIVMNTVRLLRLFINYYNAPFLLEDFRMGIVQRGYMRATINLKEYRVEQGDIAVMVPGSILEPLEMSDDFTITGMGIAAERFSMLHNNSLPTVFQGQRNTKIVHIDDTERDLITRLFASLWELNKTENIGETAVNSMIATISNVYSDLFHNHNTTDFPEGRPHDVAYNMFERFITLVNEHCREERQLEFYADCLCVTKRHLGTTVKQVSGITAKEWIDKAVITAAKVMLRHTDNSIQQITDALHFPNASFFCKYFHRLTQCTPQRWREGK